MSQQEINTSITPTFLKPVCCKEATDVSELTCTTNTCGLPAEMQPTALPPPCPPHKKVMIMGEVINNIALFVQFQEHTTVQEQNQKI